MINHYKIAIQIIFLSYNNHFVYNKNHYLINLNKIYMLKQEIKFFVTLLYQYFSIWLLFFQQTSIVILNFKHVFLKIYFIN